MGINLRKMSPRDPSNHAPSEKIFFAVFEAVGEGILLIDEDMEIVKANRRACEIFGLMAQNLVGASISSLTDDPGARTLADFFAKLIEGQRMSAEVTGVYVDNKTFPATLTVTRSDMGGKKYWQIIVRDDTDRKNMENQLLQEKQMVEEMNLTLKNVLNSIELDKKELENRVASKIKTSLLPSIKKIANTTDDSVRRIYLSLLEQQLLSLTAGFERELDGGLLKLSRTEIEVCRFIQAGSSSKDICEALKLSFDTVQTHRRNIRKKLGLNGRKLNLHAFLLNRIL
jgi:PAS domain S-box-containing protein